MKEYIDISNGFVFGYGRAREFVNGSKLVSHKINKKSLFSYLGIDKV